MSDEHILEGSDAAERPLLSYRQSWLAWAGPVLMLLVCVALCVAGHTESRIIAGCRIA